MNIFCAFILFLSQGMVLGIPPRNPAVAGIFDLSLPSLPDLPSLPSGSGLPDVSALIPKLESSGCEISKTPTVGIVSSSQMIGNWYHLYHASNVVTKNLNSELFKVGEVRNTIAVDAFDPAILKVYVCSTNTYLGGFYSHEVCPAINYQVSIQPGGVLKADVPSIAKPILSAIAPNLNQDHIEQRVIGLEGDFLVIYSCIIPLEDGTCAKNGLSLEVYGKSQQLTPESLEKVKNLVKATCVEFENLEQIVHGKNLPFYVPTEEDLWS